jgi:hypothetical protein
MAQPQPRRPLDRQTRVVLHELVGEHAPERGSLCPDREAQLCAEINYAWVDGKIPGFPDEAQLHAALRWLTRHDELEAESYGRFEAEVGIRFVDGQLDPVVVDADKAHAAGYGDLVNEQAARR